MIDQIVMVVGVLWFGAVCYVWGRADEAARAARRRLEIRAEVLARYDEFWRRIDGGDVTVLGGRMTKIPDTKVAEYEGYGARKSGLPRDPWYGDEQLKAWWVKGWDLADERSIDRPPSILPHSRKGRARPP